MRKTSEVPTATLSKHYLESEQASTVSNTASFPRLATKLEERLRGGLEISVVCTESSFLLVWAFVAICAGVKYRRLRVAIRYSNGHQPCVGLQVVGAAAVSSEMRDLNINFVSLEVVTSIEGIHGKWR